MLLLTFIAFTMTNPSFVVRQIFEMDNLTNNLWQCAPVPVEQTACYGIHFSGVLLYGTCIKTGSRLTATSTVAVSVMLDRLLISM